MPEKNFSDQNPTPLFKPLSIRNFPESLKTKLHHLAIDSDKGIGKYIIAVLKDHIKTHSKIL